MTYKYPKPLRILHWTIALLLATQLLLVLILSQLHSKGYGQLLLGAHRQVGLLLLLLVIARVIIGLRHRAPPPPQGLPAWQSVLAGFTHRLLLAALMLQPLLGVQLARARGDTVNLFGLIPLPALMQFSQAGMQRLASWHALVGGALIALTALHLGAVIFNSVVRRRPVTGRMLDEPPPGRMVDKVSLSMQLLFSFGVLSLCPVIIAMYAATKHRAASDPSNAFELAQVGAMQQASMAVNSWTELVGMAAVAPGSISGPRVSELHARVLAGMQVVAANAGSGPSSQRLQQLMVLLRDVPAGPVTLSKERVATVQSELQTILGAQQAGVASARRGYAEQVLMGQDLTLIAMVPMVLMGVVIALLLSNRILGALERMRALARAVASNSVEGEITVVGNGNFAELMRDMLEMRRAVEERIHESASQRLALEAERARNAEQQRQDRERQAQQLQRLSMEQQRREVLLAQRQRTEQRHQRERLAATFQAHVADFADVLGETVKELKRTAATMAESAAGVTERSGRNAALASETNNAVAVIAAASTQLSSSAQVVRKTSEDSRQGAITAVEEAQGARTRIDQLLTASREIGDVAQLIATVARQTNMLAINARIEAARAGQAGRGFAVVAGEVKTLAEQTQAATERITQGIQQVDQAAVHSVEVIDRVSRTVGELRAAADHIFASSDEQFAATCDIARRVSEINQATGRVAVGATDAQQTAATTQEMSQNMLHAAETLDERARQLGEKVQAFVSDLLLTDSEASDAALSSRTDRMSADGTGHSIEAWGQEGVQRLPGANA